MVNLISGNRNRENFFFPEGNKKFAEGVTNPEMPTQALRHILHVVDYILIFVGNKPRNAYSGIKTYLCYWMIITTYHVTNPEMPTQALRPLKSLNEPMRILAWVTNPEMPTQALRLNVGDEGWWSSGCFGNKPRNAYSGIKTRNLPIQHTNHYM